MKAFKEILNFIFLVPLLMVLATVLIVSTDLANGIVSGKSFWFYLSIGLVSLSVFFLININRKRVKFSLIDFLVALFCIVGGIVSYYHNGEVTNKLILLILVCILYFYFKISIAQYKWTSFILITFFILTGFIEAIWGLKQLYGFSPSQHNLFKTTGSFFNSGPYAGYLAMVFPIVLYYLLNDYRVFSKKASLHYTAFYLRWTISLITLISIILVLPATMSRASWIAAIGGSLVVAICYLLKQKNRYKNLKLYLSKHKKVVFSIIFATIIATVIALAGIYNLKKNSADGRALIWKTSTQVLLKHPLGVGLGNFSGAYGDAQAEYFATDKGTEQEQHVAGNPEYAFNEYLQICIEFGIIPFLLFISIILITIYLDLKGKQYATLGGLISLLIFCFMSYPLNLLSFVIALVFLLAVCSFKESNKKFAFNNTIKINILLIMFASIVVVCLYDRYPAYDAYKQWNRVKILYNINLHGDALKDYEKLEPYLNHEIQFLFEYASSLNKTEQYEASNRILEKAMKTSCDPMFYNIMGRNNQALGNYNKAEANFIKASSIVPSRLYPYYLLAKLYHEMGETNKMHTMSEIIASKEIKIHSPAIEEMRKEIQELCNIIL